MQDVWWKKATLNFKLKKKKVLKPIVTTSNNGCDSSFERCKNFSCLDSRKIISISVQAPWLILVPLPSVVSKFLDSVRYLFSK
jgi:hypothetical protein